ncbi:MAG: toll/interleukin-1 receptor domain-containing protein, partial [Candidatus Bipolaricaulia bacterium]
MKVFISHSTQDQRLVISLSKLLQYLEIQVFVAEWCLSPGARLDTKIKKQIKDADFVVVLLTRNGIRSTWVQQEIGITIDAGKPIIPIVERGTKPNDLAALQGREY